MIEKARAELFRYDERGNGMSDWDTPELSLDAFVDDLESVVDAAGVDRATAATLSAKTGCDYVL